MKRTVVSSPLAPKRAKTQSVFNVSKSKTCPVCGMCYYDHVDKDRAMHTKYHNNFVNGITWPNSTDQVTCTSFRAGSSDAKIVSIDKKSSRQILRVEQILEMVNQELNAPPAPTWWQKRSETNIEGRAFVVVINNRAVGVCIVDPIQDVMKQGRWMIHSSQKIVNLQVNKAVKVGISRIWIAPKWRRKGIANQLLNTVLHHMVYGMVLNKQQVAFSQPSYSGGLLAKLFNGVDHKTGETLVPVYLEDNDL